MLRYYWKRNSNEPELSKKTIRRIDGGSWFAEESDVRAVYQVLERTSIGEGILEVLKKLPEDFIETPCWEDSEQEWSLHLAQPGYSHWSLGNLQLLEVQGRQGQQGQQERQGQQGQQGPLQGPLQGGLYEGLQEVLQKLELLQEKHIVHMIMKTIGQPPSSEQHQEPYQRQHQKQMEQTLAQPRKQLKPSQKVHQKRPPLDYQGPSEEYQQQGTSSAGQKAMQGRQPLSLASHQEKESPRKLNFQTSNSRSHQQQGYHKQTQKCLIDSE